MKLAVVKPDHIGDLVLSSGAIRALLSGHPSSTLFVAPGNIGLARYLFGDIDVEPIVIPHLSKLGSAASTIASFSSFEQVILLRNDHILNERWLQMRSDWYVQPADMNDQHQSLIDYTASRAVIPPYDLDRAFFAEDRRARLAGKVGREPRRVGLSIGSGFHANSWLLAHWAALVTRLADDCDEIVILGGPAERHKAEAIRKAAKSPAHVEVVIGSTDFAGFVDRVDDLDVVVASDGGTAHLCSLVTPIVSIFGPSPYRRYAPFGRYNRLLSRMLSCSPCCQYAAHLVNGCLTTECMVNITPADVHEVMWMNIHLNSRPHMVRRPGRPVVVVGTSHLERSRLLRQFEAAEGYLSDAA